MQDIIERLEKAAGPDRYLDLAISVAINYREVFGDHEWIWSRFADELRSDTGGVLDPAQFAPRWTESIDTALALIPAGGRLLELGQWQDNGKPDGWFAQVTRWFKTGEHSWLDKGFSFGVPEQGTTQKPKLAPNGAVALCIAALKARAALSSTDGTK